MSLEKHKRAAVEAYWKAPTDSMDVAVRVACDAFLSSLADDPPEAMVEAAARPPGSHGRVAEHFARQSLSAALREAAKDPDAGTAP